MPLLQVRTTGLSTLEELLKCIKACPNSKEVASSVKGLVLQSLQQIVENEKSMVAILSSASRLLGAFADL
jgi:hypothetical protein